MDENKFLEAEKKYNDIVKMLSKFEKPKRKSVKSQSTTWFSLS